MPTSLLASLKKIYFKNKLKFLELTFLSLFLAFLPSLEAPKNIFLAGYLIIALYRQYKLASLRWDIWDWLFLSLIISSFLSALFPFVTGGAEWKGFRAMTFWISFGWVLSRSDYNFQEKKYLFIFAIIMTIPALIWGLMELLILQTKKDLQLHSVGHVNHSAIYLTMVAGASLNFLCNQFSVLKNKYSIVWIAIFSFFLTAVILGNSRGAFGILLILIFLIILLSKLSVKMKKLSLVFFIIFLITIVFINPLTVIKKQIINQNNHDVLAHRDKVWQISFEVARLNPLFGIGGGNLKYVTMDELKSHIESRGEIFDSELFTSTYSHPHNIYLANLVDRGVLGLLSFLCFMIIWFNSIVNSYKKFNKNSKNMLFIMSSFSAWVTIFGIGFVNTTFKHENALLSLFFLGLHLSLLKRKNKLFS